MSATGGSTSGTSQVVGSVAELTASSGNVANAVASATLPGVAGKTTFLAGFSVSGAGATAALAVDVTVTGPTTTLHYTFVFPAGVTTGALPLVVEFERPIPASAPNTAIVVSCPASGAGGTNAAVNAHGYQA